MIHAMRRLLAVAALLLLRSYTTAQTTRTCPAGWKICLGIGEPFLMCCPSGSTCMSLAGNTTKLCCGPDQFDCLKISPISCDLQLQNATTYPNSMLSTNLLGDASIEVNLQECVDGNGNPNCCPFGFKCENKFCLKQADQKNWITRSSTISSSATATSSSAVTTSVGTTSSSPEASITNLSVSSTDKPPTFSVRAVLAGFFPGVIFGIVLTLTTLCCLGSRRRKVAKTSKKKNISEPQPSECGRSEFTNKWQPRSQTSTPQISDASQSPPPNGLKRMGRSVKKSVSSGAAFAGAGLGLQMHGTRQEGPPVPPMVAVQAATPTPSFVAPLAMRRASRRASRRPEGQDMQHSRGAGEVTISIHADTRETLDLSGGVVTPYPMSTGSTYSPPEDGGNDRQDTRNMYLQHDGGGPASRGRNIDRMTTLGAVMEGNSWAIPQRDTRPTTAMSGGTEFEVEDWHRDVLQNGYVTQETLQQENEERQRAQNGYLTPNVYKPSRPSE